MSFFSAIDLLRKQAIFVLGVTTVLPNAKLALEKYKSQTKDKESLEKLRGMIQALTVVKKVLEELLKRRLGEKYPPTGPNTNLRPKEYYTQMQLHSKALTAYVDEIKSLEEQFNNLNSTRNNNKQEFQQCLEQLDKVGKIVFGEFAPPLQMFANQSWQAVSTLINMAGYRLKNDSSTDDNADKAILPQYRGTIDKFNTLDHLDKLSSAQDLLQKVKKDREEIPKESGLMHTKEPIDGVLMAPTV